MLSIFPNLLDLSFFAPLLLRVAAGLIFLVGGYVALFVRRKSVIECINVQIPGTGKFLAPLEGIVGLVGGALLVVGAWTQLAAIALALLSLSSFIMKLRGAKALTESVTFYFLMFVISLSLLLTGAGAFAFDLPI